MSDEKVPLEELRRILLEITLGREPAKPDTPALAEKRRRLQESVDEIRRLGGIVDIPFD